MLATPDGVAGSDEEGGLGDEVTLVREARDFPEGIFAGAHGGGTDRQARPSLPQGLHGLGRDPVSLGMHHVRGDVRRGDGLEGPGADIEHEIERLMSARAKGLQELGREVQSGRGRGRGARGRGVGVHGLITLGIIRGREPALLACFDDVRRQRDFAKAFREVLHGLARRQVETHAVFAVRVLDGDGAPSVDDETGGITGTFAGAQHAPPFEGIQRGTEQQTLDFTPGGTHTEEACLQHRDIIADEHGAGRQELGQVAETAMLDRARGAAHDEQARGVAPRGRRGGDAFGREFEIQLFETHAIRLRSWAG